MPRDPPPPLFVLLLSMTFVFPLIPFYSVHFTDLILLPPYHFPARHRRRPRAKRAAATDADVADKNMLVVTK